MNYRHIYHAGNFADVFKHLLLISLLKKLIEKDKPCFYLDTHAGIGNYDLDLPEAQKSQEFQSGITRFLLQADSADSPPVVRIYRDLIKSCNETGHLRYYPGSPFIAKMLLREEDRLCLNELHPADFQLLKTFFKQDKRIAIHHNDGYQALKAFLPPAERRGLVLIDPPYEQKNEFNQIITHLKTAIKRWPMGIYAIWYPIKNPIEMSEFQKLLSLTMTQKTVDVQFFMTTLDNAMGLNACGMVIINPPWQWEKEIRPVLTWLCHALKMGKSTIRWLIKEKK